MKTFTKKTIIIFGVILSVLISQAQTVEWANKYASYSGSGGGNAIATDLAGNIYTTGYINYFTTFGSQTLSPQAGDVDAFLTKTDPSGNVLWVKGFGDNGFDIDLDAAGNIYVSGSFSGTDAFGSFTITAYTLRDMFICKIDPLGNIVWVNHYAAANPSNISMLIIESICCDPTGNIYAAGSFSGSVAFGTFTASSSGNRDAFLVKFDPLGNVQWLNKFGGVSIDNISGIKSDATGNIYATGSFAGAVAFGSTSYTTSGQGDIFVSKINPSGSFVWTKQFAGNGNASGISVSINSLGKIYLTASYTDSITLGTYTLSAGNSFVAQIDVSGTILWATNFKGYAFPESITSDPSGNVYTIGQFADTTSFGGTQPAAILVSNAFSLDVFISKLNSSGNFVWVKQFTGASYKTGNSIVYRSSSVYITGTFEDLATIDSFSLSTPTSSQYAYVIKVSADPVGIKENLKNIDVKIYPNPVSDKLVIESIEFNQNLQVSVTDFLGKEVLKQNFINSNNGTLDASMLLPGIYFVRISSDKESGVVKIVKE